MTSAMLLSQLIFDYPSGSLGDWIGQRWVLALSYSTYSVAYLFLATAQSFTSFVLVAILMGFANAQASGTLRTWLESNYQKVASEIDPERKLFGFTVTRVGTLNYLASLGSFITGGAIATLISRRMVFSLQVGAIFILVVLVLILVKDISVKEIERPVTEKKGALIDYFKYFKGGLSFVCSSRVSFFFIVGQAIFYVTWYVWGSLILYPIYFGYSGSDAGAALVRSTIFALGMIASIIVANISKRFSNHHYPYFLFIHAIIFFPCYFVLLTLLPVNDTFNLLGMLTTIFIQNSTIGFLFNTGNILQRRIMLDLVPSENRNSVYSLIPTIIALIGIPVLPFAGSIIDSYGLTAGLVICFTTCIVGSLSMTYALWYKRKTETRIKVQFIEEMVIVVAG
jgi:MFS family permease